jgi:hypothetical protein
MHNGTDGNEMADFMANKGAILAVEVPKPFRPFSNEHAKTSEKRGINGEIVHLLDRTKII